jgi:hypothetical protein
MPGKQPKAPRAAAVVRRGRPAHVSTGLTTIELQAATSPHDVAELHRAIEAKDTAPLSFDEAFDRMATATAKFNPEKIKMEDVARSGGAPDKND